MNKTGFPIKGLINEVFIPHFQKHGESAIPGLVNSTISKMSFLSAYKHLPPIESMPEKEKKEMKMYVINLFPYKTTAEKMEACKIIYTIGTLI
jgi:hypothetical protein